MESIVQNDLTQLPEDFVELVRDALLHVYDLVHLQTHPLVAITSHPDAGPAARGRFLRQALLDAVESLRPSPGVALASRAWRTYYILERRYIEGYEASDVADQLALSRAQYHREQHRALQEIALLQWERRQVADSRASIGGGGSPRSEGSSDLARTEARQLMPVDGTGRIDALEVLREVMELLRPLYTRSRIALRLDTEESRAPIRGERVALRHALLSILAHATEASGGGPVEISPRFGPGGVEITISGQASGRLDPERLGLLQSRPFVEALNGELVFRCPSDQPGRWAVQFSFPIATRSTLLVVDNNADFIRLIERYLLEGDWDVIGVSDVDQAFADARRQHPRAILLDVVIPGRDGWDLLLELKSDLVTRDIPVIILSVLNEPEIAVSLGAALYLQKPIGQRELVAALRRYL